MVFLFAIPLALLILLILWSPFFLDTKTDDTDRKK